MTEAARLLRYARRRAGLTQRALAAKAGVPQPYVARVESGRTDPGVTSLSRLLRACGMTLDPLPWPGDGDGVDRDAMRERLRLTPAERLARAAGDGAADALRARGGAFVVVGAAAAALHGAPVDVGEVAVVSDGEPAYADLAAGAVRMDLGGFSVSVAAVDDLLRVARADAPGDVPLLLALRDEAG